MQRFLLISLLSVFALACSSHIPNKTRSNVSDTNVQTVENFVQAFNERNLEGMLALVAEDVQWLSIDGQKLSTETTNKTELSIAMQDYFSGCESCRSNIKNINSNKNWVCATETASWNSKTGSKSQSSFSVYEFENGLIKRVYYFPSEEVK